MKSPPLFVCLVIALGLAASACSGEQTPDRADRLDPKILSFLGPEEPIDFGDVATLSWRTSGASEVRLQVGEEILSQGEKASGLLEVEPDRTSVYELIAAANGKERRAQREVRVRPVILEFATVEEGPFLVGEPLEVRWEVGGAASVRVTAGPESEEIDVEEETEGLSTLTVPASGVITLVAKSGDLETVGTLELDVLDLEPPKIVSFAAAPEAITEGIASDVQVSWNTEGASALSLFADESPIALGEISLDEGSLGISLQQATTLRLEARNAAGVVSAEVSIVALPLPFASLQAIPARVAAFEVFELRWDAGEAASFELYEEGILVEGASEPWGSVDRAIASDTTYRLLARNEVGGEREVSLVVSVGAPIIQSFRATPAVVAPEASVTLEWESDGGSSLEILGPDGVAISSCNSSSPSMIANGSCQIEAPAERGPHRYALVVRNGSSESDSMNATLQVAGGPLEEVPSVAFASSQNDYDPLVDPGGISLAWTATNGASLVLWKLDGEGEVIEPPIHSTDDPSDVASGSIVVDPDETTSFRVVVENVYGDVAIDEAVVDLLLVEIESFVAAPDELLAGDPTTLSWATKRATAVGLDIDTSYSLQQGQLPFIELREREGTRELPISGTCGVIGGSALDQACPGLLLETFAFPFGGQLHDRVLVSVNGALTFDTLEVDTNQVETFPPVVLPWETMIAPLWSDFLADPARGSKLLYAFEEEEGLQQLIVEWSQVYPKGRRLECSASFTFQAILREDGSFEFRYGPFGAYRSDANCPELHASAGFYARSSGQSGQLLYGAEPEGGLSGTSHTYTPAVIGLSDSIDVPVSASRSYTLTAYGAKGSKVSQRVRVVAGRLPTIRLVKIENPTQGRFYPMVGKQIPLTWMAEDVLEMEVLGPDGVICSVDETFPIGGSCAVSSDTPGPVTYTVRGYGILQSKVEREFVVNYVPLLEIGSFTTSPETLEYGEGGEVVVSWETTGAETFELLIDGRPIEPTILADEWASGARMFSIDRSTTFSLILGTADGNEASQVRTVDVRTVDPLVAGASSSTIAPGGSTTLSWETTTQGEGQPYVTVEPSMVPMEEVFDAPFVDISATGTRLAGFSTLDQSVGSAVVELPFEFPYFGETYSKVEVTQNGFVSFELGVFPRGYVTGFLTWFNIGTERPHIGPYWSDLRTYSVGDAYTAFEAGATTDRDRFIIQWDRMQLYRSTIPTPGSEDDELSFQLVLFRDGSFEFRYGTMNSPSEPTRAMGVRATGGYRKPGRHRVELGSQLFDNPANPFGFSHRTWRYRALRPTDSLVVSPTGSTEYRICVHHLGFEECRMVQVAVPALGDLIITELQLRPESGVGKQWFELRNLSAFPIDLGGMTLESGSGSTLIDPGGLTIEPRQYLTLAASAGVAFEPDYVYGSELSLGDAVDRLRILQGAQVLVDLGWDERWTIPAAKTLSLDPIHHKPLPANHQHFNAWCVHDEFGSPGEGKGCSSESYLLDPYSDRALIDVSATATRVQQLDGSKHAVALPGGLGFEMPFFGDRVERVWITSNGFVGFEGTPIALHGSDPFPSGRGGGLVAGLWNGLQSLPDVWKGLSWAGYDRRMEDGMKVAVFHWERKRRYTSSGVPEEVGDVTVQIQLWENGDIVMVYPTMSGDPEHFGAAGTVGIQSLDGREAVQYLHHEAALSPGQALHFRYVGDGG